MSRSVISLDGIFRHILLGRKLLFLPTVWKKEKGEAIRFPFFFGSCYGFARLFGCSLFIEFLQDSLGDVEFFIGGE